MNIKNRLSKLECRTAPADACPHFKITYEGEAPEEHAPMPPLCAECDAPYKGEIIIEYVDAASVRETADFEAETGFPCTI